MSHSLEDRVTELENKLGELNRGIIIFVRTDSETEYQQALAEEYLRLGTLPLPDDHIVCFHRMDCRKHPLLNNEKE